MGKTTVSVPVSDELLSPIEDRENDGETRAEATRHFIRKGVDAEREPATDGGKQKVRLSFLDLMLVVISLSTVMTWLLAMNTGGVYVTWAWRLTAASVVVIAIYFGQIVFDVTGSGNETTSR